jgi:dedicator of cytokinesis protein 6/7/8
LLLIHIDSEVNAGPLAIARTFLKARTSFPAEDVSRLEEALKLFVHLCHLAVKLNKTLIGADQREFQEHLEKGYESLHHEISQLLPM